MCSVLDFGRVGTGRECSAVMVRVIYLINNQRAFPSAQKGSDSDLPRQSFWGLWEEPCVITSK